MGCSSDGFRVWGSIVGSGPGVSRCGWGQGSRRGARGQGRVASVVTRGECRLEVVRVSIKVRVGVGVSASGLQVQVWSRAHTRRELEQTQSNPDPSPRAANPNSDHTC